MTAGRTGKAIADPVGPEVLPQLPRRHPRAGLVALMRRRAYVDAVAMDEITILQAEVLKVLASPVRLEILHRLANGPIDVGRLAGEIGTSQPHASQHLAILRAAGLVEAERRGREMHYRLADPDVLVACDVMRAVLGRRLARLASVAGRLQHAHPAPVATAAGNA
jgi:DNA-binding transcriptional ArsR family regulator